MTYTSTQSLIITIIVLLILAGISISMISGENGILTRTTEAKEKTIIGQEKEAIGIGWNALMQEKWLYDTDITNTAFQEELNRNGNDVTVTTDDEGNFLVYFEDTKHTYKVEKDGTITLIENVAEVEPTEIIYVTLYTDGTLAFSNNNSTDSSKTLSKTYTIEKGDSFDTEDDILWKNERSQIQYVDFVNKIVPTNTACWFWGCVNLQEIQHIENLNTSKTTSMFAMFAQCEKIQNIDLSNFNTTKVNNIAFMFWQCINLEKLDVSKFDTRNVLYMINLFAGENGKPMSLKEIKGYEQFNTSKVKSMEGMFYNCLELLSIDVSNYDTKNVTNMRCMFAGFDGQMKYTEIKGLENFDTSNVENMEFMFERCGNIKTLNLSNFNTKKVTNMGRMFILCENLKTIYIAENWSTENVTDSTDMFYNCVSLIGENETTYSSSYIDKTYARIDKEGQPGYFTDIRQNLEENNTELEYIESTGTQYIDTNYSLWKNSNWKIELKFDVSEFYDYNNMFGFLDITDTSNEVWIASDKTYYIRIGEISKTSISSLNLNTPYTIIHDNTGNNLLNYVNGTLVETLSKANTSNSNTLGFCHREGSKYLKGKIYYLKFWSDGNLVRDFIPVHNTITNSAGLYDKVNKRFYPNNGTGSFTEGSVKSNS